MSAPREHWGSKLGFIFAAIGSAIGLGVLWKFPYTVGQNGGGYFLLAFILCILIIGIPVFIAELMLGRKAQSAAVMSFDKLSNGHRFWKLGGWLGVISSFLIMSFYSVIAGYGMSYILMSLTNFSKGLSAQEVSDVYVNLTKSADISLLWHFIFTAVTMAIVFSGVRKGIEYWAKIMTKGLFIFMILLFFYSMTMEGFGEAANFIFAPNAENFKFSSILEALGLAFFTLSLGQGIMISYGSYMKKDDNLPSMSLIVASSVIVVALLAAMVVFPVVFTYGMTPKAGTGLIFQTVPFLFAKLPGSILLSTLFFVLFVFTAITSAVAFIEVCATNLMELTGVTRKKGVLIVSAGTFLFGIFSALANTGLLFAEWKEIYGMNFLDNVDYVVSSWLIPIGGLITSLFAGWIFDKRIAQEEFGPKSRKWFAVWHLCLRWIVPLLIIMIILQKTGIFDFDQLFAGS
ncbi:MAG: sodium-dependent transporter [Rhabdochlamydiaceae bacterium]|nr:sodium-dependent transporter [Candidatus Amphrikana amoebophyrae]